MTERPPLRPTALALLISVIASGLLCVWAVAAAPDHIRTPLAWCSAGAAVLFSAAVATTVHAVTYAGRTSRALRARIDQLTGENSQFGARTARLTAEYEARITQLTATHEAREAELIGQREATAAGLTGEYNARTAQLNARISRAESARSAALSAASNAAGRMQALATGMLADLREMEHRHTDEDVLTDLLHLDHRTAQAGRLADSIAVLAGARSGRRWAKPIVMESILRGAMGRIAGYQRVRLHSTSEIAIAGHAAEGIMHALAELLDNAANFSPPTAEVHVYVEEVPAGVIVTIEDSGLVMSDVQLRRAERAVTAETTQQTDLAGLSGTRLGLAVVGRLARKHGLTVSFRPSARGGTGVLVLLPHELITRTPRPSVPAPLATPAQHTRPAAALSPSATEALLTRRTAEAAQAAGTPRTAEAAPGPLPVRTPAPAPLPTRTPAPAPASASEPDTTTASPEPEPDHSTPELGASGLPQRRRGQTMAAAHPDGTIPGSSKPVDPTSSTTSAARFSTFRQAVRGDSPNPEGSSS
ncbi:MULTISPECIES: ATP-binding protein [unclassified Streptomyces]|uniref:ATP-binding protein n=1 Tax=unclassified Streptomyces TaxID=2593676 RepID=UPI002E12D1E6|nr:ATP-binding protein [Streptomyces sp. NBC_01197]WSS49907.1 ATP-binding protein [Streptomyces sp. NBC_01180]